MTYKYPEIKQYFIDKIKNREFTEGQMLPTERELTSLFNVSRMTVRRALDELIDDGFLVRKKGCGVIVTHPKESRSVDKFSFKKDKDIISKYGPVVTKVVEFKKTENSLFADKYFLNDTGDIYQLKRIQYGKDRPVVYENLFFNQAYFKNLETMDFSQSMSDILNHTLKVSINHEEIMIDAILADKEVADMLLVAKNSPILQITNLQKCGDDVVYFGVDFLDGNEFNYKIHNML